MKNISDYGILADRNCAGLTEISLRIRGYEQWFLDTMIDPAGIEKLFGIMAPGDGSVFSIVHDIQDDVPPQNFRAMWDTITEYGKY